ncbi:MAG: hypothetical protein SF187_05350 [Deltaproteobacteria bacterium]|nr:hypothetical protein [Deltaproteobacteria bacterium]
MLQSLAHAFLGLCLAFGVAACEAGSGADTDATPPDAAADTVLPTAVSLGNVLLLAAASHAGWAVLAHAPMNTSEAPGQLVWLNNAGKAVGAPQALAGRPTTLATDGEQAIACWDRGGAVTCQCHARGGQASRLTFEVAGSKPSLVFGNETYLLVYVGIDKQVRLQRVAAACEPVGETAVLHQAFLEQYGYQIPVISTMGGWLVAAGDPVHLHRLGPDFTALQAPVDLKMPPWFYGSLAAVDDDFMVYLAKPYGGQIFLVQGAKVTEGSEITAGGKQGADVLLATEGRHALAVWNSGGSLQQHEMGAVAATMFAAGDATTPKPLGMQMEDWSRYALVKIGDQQRLAARVEGELKLFNLHGFEPSHLGER